MARSLPVATASPAVRRLQRLRLRLTVVFALASAIGLVVLTLVAVTTDRRLRDDEIRAETQRRARSAQVLIAYDQGRLYLDAFVEDEIANSSPQLFLIERVVPGRGAGQPLGSPTRRAFQPKQIELDTGPNVEAAADRAMAAGGLVTMSATLADGTEVPLAAIAILDENANVRAAAVAVGDPRRGEAEHSRFALTLWVGAAALGVMSALLGYLLAGRSIRPAAAAIEQQERFLADAAHELRTPLARLRTTAEAGATDPSTAVEALSSIAALAGTAGEVVDDLLMLARMDAGAVALDAQKLRLDQLVADVVEQHPGVTFSGAASIVVADPVLVRRAVENLVTNAVRHGGGAEVTVSVAGGVIVVADRGPGIEPAVEPFLFERFRSGATTGGSGLGLSIVRQIAEAHGGTVDGGNRADGKGAEFALSLPT